MALLCPQCGEIHFETTTTPLPNRCRQCNADLSQASGLMPGFQLEEAQANAPPSPPKVRAKALFGRLNRSPGFKGILVGCGFLVAAGVMLFLGIRWHTGVKEAKAIVHVSTDAPKWAKRDRLSATYTVNGKKYPQYPGVRSEGATFTVYYLPGDPATGYEMKPFLWLVIGGGVLLIGLGVLAFGVVKFGIGRAQAADHEKVMAGAG